MWFFCGSYFWAAKLEGLGLPLFPKKVNLFIIPANIVFTFARCLYLRNMGLIASLREIDQQKDSVFVMHEKSEKLIPLHKHTKGQLSYVQGGIAYITINYRTYVVPARHYFWIPQGMQHILRIGYSATVFRSLYFYAHDDLAHPFYSKLGIYPASELLIQMINYTERWDGRHVSSKDENFEFLVALKNILPQLNNNSLPIILPTTDKISGSVLPLKASAAVLM
jgi:hypothetical protein